MLIGHGGNIYALAQRLECAPSDIIDMSSNVNPQSSETLDVRCSLSAANLTLIEPKLDQVSVVRCP
jgi:hypothetical protein